MLKTYAELVAGGKSNASKVRLILTAERLFADRGIEGVSLREIAVAAGSANNNAVQYHFATKQGLLNAIYAFRIGQMEERRTALLEEAEAAGRARDPAALLRILGLPHLDLVADDGSYPYAGFIVQFATRHWHPDPRHGWVNAAEVAPTLQRVTRALRELSGLASEEHARARVLMCQMMFVNALLRWDKIDRDAGTLSLEETLAHAFAAMEAALAAQPDPARDGAF